MASRFSILSSCSPFDPSFRSLRRVSPHRNSLIDRHRSEEQPNIHQSSPTDITKGRSKEQKDCFSSQILTLFDS